MRQHLRTLAVVVLLAVGPVASASADTAQDTRLALSADGTTWAQDITTPLLDPGMRWVPGDTQVAGLWFRNQSGTPAEGYAEVTIGPQEAELAADLAVRTRYDGGAWAAGTASPPMTLADGQMVRLDIEVTFDPLSSNESMDRTVPMTVRVVLAGDGAPGAGQEQPGEPAQPGGALPATGAAVVGAIAAALALLAAGAWLVVVARRRAMSRAPRRVLLAAGVTLGMLAGAGVAWAWWGASGTASGSGPLPSATLDLTVTGLEGTLNGHGGTATLPALAMTDATPGSSDSEVFTVHNSGTTPFTPSGTGTGQGDLGPHLEPTVLWGGTDAGDTCADGSDTSPPLAPGGQITVCVAVTLADDAPVTAQNATGTMLFTLDATQVQS